MKNYKLAGCISLLSAILAIPTSIFMILSMFGRQDEFSGYNIIITLISSVIFLAMMFYLRAFLDEKLGLGKQNGLMGSIVLLYISSNVSLLFFDMENMLGLIMLAVISVGLTIPLGILYFVLSQRILKSEGVSNVSHAKAFSYTMATTGLLLATLIFSEISILTSIIMDIFLALMFFFNNTQEKPASTPQECQANVS